MAETKKRFRPSLTAYRALENEVSELKEELAKYKQTHNQMSVHVNEVVRIEKKSLQTELDQLQIKYKTLLKSNNLLEQERDRNHQTISNMSKQNKLLYNELQAIKSRGFWKRLFNCK